MRLLLGPRPLPPWQLFLWVCGFAAAVAAAAVGGGEGGQWGVEGQSAGRGVPVEKGGPSASIDHGNAAEVDGPLQHGSSGKEEAPRLLPSSTRASVLGRGAPGVVSSQGARPRPTARRRGFLAGVERHRALLLALFLGAALMARGGQLLLTGRGFGAVDEARADLAHRVRVLEERKKEAAVLRKEAAEAQGVAARKEGLVERLREELREQETSLAAEELALLQRSKDLEKRRARVVKAKGGAEAVSKRLRNKQPAGEGAVADPLHRAEAELAVLDLATSALPREREKTMLVRELSEVVKMRAAAAVLRALPAEPKTSEEARDVLRAKRMLMSSVVRVQSIAWAGITRLLEVKGELQVEHLLSTSPEMRFLKLIMEEWKVKHDEQERLLTTLDQLEEQLTWCLEEQHKLYQDALQLGPEPPPERLEELELRLFSLENFEVSVRARKAQITYAEGSGLLTRAAFIQQRTCRVERAKDNAAERKRRLSPFEADANLEVQLSMSALGRVLKELQEIFQEAKALSDEFEGADPRLKPHAKPSFQGRDKTRQ